MLFIFKGQNPTQFDSKATKYTIGAQNCSFKFTLFWYGKTSNLLGKLQTIILRHLFAKLGNQKTLSKTCFAPETNIRCTSPLIASDKDTSHSDGIQPLLGSFARHAHGLWKEDTVCSGEQLNPSGMCRLHPVAWRIIP